MLLKRIRRVLILNYYLISFLYSQELEELYYGDNNSLDIVTWNIEWFPKNNQITINYVSQIISLLELDVLAIQELDDTTMFNQMLDSLPEYSGYYTSSWFAGLAFIYKEGVVHINDIYEIYTTSLYWNNFPRSPMVMDLEFAGQNYIIINNHFKCCGDGIIDFEDNSDEENRRYNAMNLIKEYIDINYPNDNVIVLGDLNDDIAEDPPNNVFQEVLNDSFHYYFADLTIAQGTSSGWSFPNWPSHLDHILITDELFDKINNSQTQVIKIDEYVEGGWSEYEQNISDHRPVAIKLNIIPFYDLNNDGFFNESDFEFLMLFIINHNELITLVDLNFDSFADIFDLLILSDFLTGL